MIPTTMMTATTLKNMWSVLQARLLHSFLHSLCFSSLLQQWTPLPWTLHTWSHSVTGNPSRLSDEGCKSSSFFVSCPIYVKSTKAFMNALMTLGWVHRATSTCKYFLSVLILKV